MRNSKASYFTSGVKKAEKDAKKATKKKYPGLYKK
jgi:hypothetical protein